MVKVENPRRERIVNRYLEEELRDSFIDYSMSVIVQRALPDARDGLKPVQRRILYAMHEQGLAPEKAHKKSATVVGDVLGKYHPHGDAAVYETLVRMAQPFSMRYPLVDGQGNFGSIDGDPAAAYRYTEARLTSIATDILRDLEKDTIDFRPNFDGRLKEPEVLPAAYPQLLVSGSDGIAVGMATKIPPHNLREIAAAAAQVLARPNTSVNKLLEIVSGPDFPTGAYIWGDEGIGEAYRTGRGRIVMRARAHVEQGAYGKPSLVVTEIPYQVSKQRVIESIVDLVRKGRLDGITDLRDESDRDGVRIVMELKRDANPRKLLEKLFTKTQLQYTFGVIALALVGGVPRQLNLKQALEVWIDHRLNVVVRRARFNLQRAEERAHILEGLLNPQQSDAGDGGEEPAFRAQDHGEAGCGDPGYASEPAHQPGESQAARRTRPGEQANQDAEGAAIRREATPRSDPPRARNDRRALRRCPANGDSLGPGALPTAQRRRGAGHAHLPHASRLPEDNAGPKREQRWRPRSGREPRRRAIRLRHPTVAV